MALPYPQLVLFGDSLFQGAAQIQDGFSFEGALQAQCIRRLDVVNRGLSGYNTSQALKALPLIFAPPEEGGPKMKYLFVLLGANDASLPQDADDVQHVPLEQFRRNLTAIITHPRVAAHGARIFLVTPPPLDEMRVEELDLAKGYAAATRQTAVSAAYSEAVRQVAAQHAGAATLVDLHAALMETALRKTPSFERPGPGAPALGDPACGRRGYLEHLLPDGLHMSGEAYRVFFDLVSPLVGPEWAEAAAATPDDRTDYVLPDWKTAPWLE